MTEVKIKIRSSVNVPKKGTNCEFILIFLEVIKTVDIDFPYYYRHEIDSDFGESVIYGKCLEEYMISIHESHTVYEDSFEMEVSTRNDNSYYDEKFLTTKEEYEAAKLRMIQFINGNSENEQ